MTGVVAAWIGLGANLGDAAGALKAAVQALAGLPRCSGLRVSATYRSAPIESSGPDYLNAVAVLDTTLGAHELLAHLQAIEAAHGRERPYRNAPRTLDLDLLLYGDAQIDTSTLVVPHPRLHQRAFVLRPMSELAPELHIPVLGSLAALLPAVADQRIERLDA